MADARINFRIRSKMTHSKMTQESDNAHAKSLQNDDDLVEYFREVLNIREKRRTSEQ